MNKVVILLPFLFLVPFAEAKEKEPSAASYVEITRNPKFEKQIARIVAGPLHSCVLLTDGRVHCWGSREGRPSSAGRLNNIKEIVVGRGHFAARDKAGAITIWDRTRFETWITKGADRVVVGDHFTCARLHDKSQVVCEGDEAPPAERLEGLEAKRGLWAAGTHLCLNDGAGILHCFSDGKPKNLPGDWKGVTDLALSRSQLCATFAEARVECFGLTDAGKKIADDLSFKDVAQVAVGRSLGCVRFKNGKKEPECWGLSSEVEAEKTRLGVKGLIDLIASEDDMAATYPDTSVAGWGGRHPYLYAYLKLRGVTTIAAGGHHVCGFTPQDKVLCDGGGQGDWDFQRGMPQFVD